MPTVRRLRIFALVIAAASIGLTSTATPTRADTTLANWGQQSPAQSPPGLVYAGMAYDSLRGRTVLFGGGTDTWEWDGSRWTAISTTIAPGSSIGPGMVYDSDRHVTVLLDNNGNTWEWNGSSWVKVSTGASPPARVWTSMAYDAQLGVTVMWGGDHIEPFLLGPINDTWLWDGTNWTRDWTAATPIYRAGQAMAYDSARGRIVLFGGTDEGFPGITYNDTWEFGSGIVTPAGNPGLSFQANMIYFLSTGIGTTTSPAQLRIFGAGTGPTLISSITTTR